MKIRSKKLWQYLHDKGVLQGSKSDIAQAKLEYRRMYKREWRKSHKLPQKELRLVFSIREYMDIKVKASLFGLQPTAYLKELALKSLDLKQIVPEKEWLIKILQLLTMAATSSNINHKNNLLEAETLLLQYIQKY